MTAEHIIIADGEARKVFTADGMQTVFDYDFPIFQESDLKVYLAGSAVPEGSGYGVTGAGISAGGTVVFDSAPAAGSSVVLVRDVPIERVSDFSDSGAFRASVINTELDRLTAIAQQLATRIRRSVRQGDFDPAALPVGGLNLPAPEPNKLLGWNSGGTGLENKTISDGSLLVTSAFIDTLLDDSDAAAARATLGLETVSRPEAEAGTATVERAWTSERVAQAINALAPGLSPVYGHNGSLAPHENLVVQNLPASPASGVAVDADAFVVTNSAGEQIRLTNVARSALITASGAGGLDTGTEASSTWYHIWVIWNGATAAALLSTSALFDGLALPAGYTHGGYVGAVFNNAAGNLMEMYQTGNRVASGAVAVLNAGTATGYTNVDLSGAIPPTAALVRTSLYVVDLSTANCAMFVRSGTVNGQNLGLVVNAGATTNGAAESQYVFASFPILVPQQLQYASATASDQSSIFVIGWEY